MPSITPGKTICILCVCQLGRMLAMAAAEMGYHVHIYCPEENCPASQRQPITPGEQYWGGRNGSFPSEDARRNC